MNRIRSGIVISYALRRDRPGQTDRRRFLGTAAMTFAAAKLGMIDVFTGRAAFDEILPVADGRLEASLRVDLAALQADMEDWLTREFGGGRTVKLRLAEERK